MSSSDKKHDEDEVMLPGFKFHPTDEELVAFYLKRKVENRQLSIELIKHINIYKYDPWELPKGNNDQEWYFFCLRGRKYRNSMRPNRVTGSGFWKATGIDKPIYSFKEPHQCIGLKKSLVYYRGSAGKGTKTDWMMHEFRLPPRNTAGQHINLMKTNSIPLEAEVWTLCRIFKRITSYKGYIPLRLQPKRSDSGYIHTNDSGSGSKTCGDESDHNNNDSGLVDHSSSYRSNAQQNNQFQTKSSLTCNSFDPRQARSDHHFANSAAGFWNAGGNVMFAGDCGGDWNELRAVVDRYAIDFAKARLLYYDCE